MKTGDSRVLIAHLFVYGLGLDLVLIDRIVKAGLPVDHLGLAAGVFGNFRIAFRRLRGFIHCQILIFLALDAGVGLAGPFNIDGKGRAACARVAGLVIMFLFVCHFHKLQLALPHQLPFTFFHDTPMKVALVM